MSKNIFVGNLPFSSTEEEVRELFEQYGEVVAVRIVTDRDTGRSRGFGFVEMDEADSENAIQSLDGVELQGRALRVNEARRRNSDRQSSSW